jgi:hypothetical protein
VVRVRTAQLLCTRANTRVFVGRGWCWNKAKQHFQHPCCGTRRSSTSNQRWQTQAHQNHYRQARRTVQSMRNRRPAVHERYRERTASTAAPDESLGGLQLYREQPLRSELRRSKEENEEIAAVDRHLSRTFEPDQFKPRFPLHVASFSFDLLISLPLKFCGSLRVTAPSAAMSLHKPCNACRGTRFRTIWA